VSFVPLRLLRLAVAVVRRVPVRVILVVRVAVLTLHLTVVGVCLAMLVQPELRGRQPGPQDPIRREVVSGNQQASERRLELSQREAGIQKGAEHHVSGRSGEAIEIENLGHDYRYPDSFRLQ
jgi:hypothetical protein